MKRQVDKTGGKLWFNENLIEGFQDQLYKAIEAHYKPFGSCIVSGCEVTGSNIAEGIVYLDGKIMPFAGASGASFPCYLKMKMTPVTGAYDDGHSDSTEEIYEAILSSTIPSSEYITISAQGGKTFRQAFQDANNRMVSDAKINEWNSLSGSKANKNGNPSERFDVSFFKAFNSYNLNQRVTINNGLIYNYDDESSTPLDLPLSLSRDIIAKANGRLCAKSALESDDLVNLGQLNSIKSSNISSTSTSNIATSKAVNDAKENARSNAVSEVRGDISESFNTLKKLYDWVLSKFALKNGNELERFNVGFFKAFNVSNLKQRVTIHGGAIYNFDDEADEKIDLPLNLDKTILARDDGTMSASPAKDANDLTTLQQVEDADSNVKTVLRDGIDTNLNTLKKLHAWSNTNLASKANKNGNPSERFDVGFFKAFNSYNLNKRVTINNGSIYNYDDETNEKIDLALNNGKTIIAKEDGTMKVNDIVIT